MIIAAAAVAVGILACVLVVLLLWKKKLPKSWGISLLVCGVILGITGTLGIVRQIQTRSEEYKDIYMALQYLEQGQTDPAALYLKRVDNTGYYLSAAQILLEQVRGNDTVAQMRLDVLESMQGDRDDQEHGLTQLQTWMDSENGLQEIVDTLKDELPLSTEERDQLDQEFAVETGQILDGVSKDTQDLLRLQINRALWAQDWYGAVESATQLVKENGSVSNRLLLAEVIADVTYSGNSLTTYQFSEQQTVTKDTQAEEYEELMNQYSELSDELELLEKKMQSGSKEEQEELSQKSEELMDQAENIQRQAENIFALRALNSIADIHSLEAQVVRARLYFAMNSYQEAINTLCESADSVQVALSGNKPLVNALRLVNQIYKTDDDTGVDMPEFREELQVLLGSVHPEMIQLSLTPLATDFTQRIISDQKTYGSGLYIVGMDTSQYPQIQVQLGGQTDSMETIVEDGSVVLNDTHAAVDSYEVDYSSAVEDLNSICFVMDTSGSMDGTPLTDAKEALVQFLENTPENVELGLVRFESGAEILADLTAGTSMVRAAVESLWASGGTDITAGIQEGTQVLNRGNGARTMILMTDGQSDVDLNVVQSAVEQGITIFTVGFGSVNDELLQTIADMSGGQYIRADSSTELVNVYNSLQGIIGNTITLTYTVQDTEEDTRYFFLMDQEHNRSVRRSYSVDETEEQATGEENDVETATVEVSSAPVMYTREELDIMADQQQGATFTIQYEGTGLDTVAAAYIGDTSCTVDGQDVSTLILKVPATLANGEYELRLQTQQGDTFTFPHMLIVGDMVYCQNFQAGSLKITTSRALLLDNVLIIGNKMRLQEALIREENAGTLDLWMTGTLFFSNVSLPEGALGGEKNLDQIDLGNTGTAQGQGFLYVTDRDQAYVEYANSLILQGSMVLEYDTEESRFLTGVEGEEAEQ